MKLCIHRGSREIGGSCVELKCWGKSLLLDLGIPLDLEVLSEAEFPKSLHISNDTLGLLVSHYHLDHLGLVSQLRHPLPLGMGASAWKVQQAASPFLYQQEAPPTVTWKFRNEETITIGPFQVTPYLMDHSAFDAYAFLIECEEKRIFYTGDFRAHGRKPRLFERLIKKSLGRMDALIMEGTTIGISNGHTMVREKELEEEFEKVMRTALGAVLVNCSSQNIDRIVTLFRAAKRTGRKLVIDLYTAEILRGTETSSIPQSDWDDVELYIPHPQRVYIKKKKLFDILNNHSAHRIFQERLISNADEKVLLFRPSFLSDHTLSRDLQIGAYIYSQWKGYLDNESNQRVQKWLEERQIREYYIHTSGHAGLEDLQRLVAAVNPNKVIPIHSFHPQEFEKYFENVLYCSDGEWKDI